VTKGAKTREQILFEAACLFNVKGYSGAALRDMMHATGLGKGGIYNHFESKEKLAVDAFDYAVSLIQARFDQALAGVSGARERLRAYLAFFEDYSRNPPIPGGCPIMNTAIEHDDGNPELRRRSREAMERWRQFIVRTVRRGIKNLEMRPDIDPEQAGTVFIATIEGAVMLAKLYGDLSHVDHALAHLKRYIEESLASTPRQKHARVGIESISGRPVSGGKNV
jgi:TetR/AcrR family transcriptional repressor of nem operon